MGVPIYEGGGGRNSGKYDLFVEINNTREWRSPSSVSGAWGMGRVKFV